MSIKLQSCHYPLKCTLSEVALHLTMEIWPCLIHVKSPLWKLLSLMIISVNTHEIWVFWDHVTGRSQGYFAKQGKCPGDEFVGLRGPYWCAHPVICSTSNSLCKKIVNVITWIISARISCTSSNIRSRNRSIKTSERLGEKSRSKTWKRGKH